MPGRGKIHYGEIGLIYVSDSGVLIVQCHIPVGNENVLKSLLSSLEHESFKIKMSILVILLTLSLVQNLLEIFKTFDPGYAKGNELNEGNEMKLPCHLSVSLFSSTSHPFLPPSENQEWLPWGSQFFVLKLWDAVWFLPTYLHLDTHQEYSPHSGS